MAERSMNLKIQPRNKAEGKVQVEKVLKEEETKIKKCRWKMEILQEKLHYQMQKLTWSKALPHH